MADEPTDDRPPLRVVEDGERPARPTCGAPRKRDGEPCQSTAVGEDGRCGLHSGRLNAAEMAERSAEVRRELGKSVRERLREKVEEQLETVWSTFLEGMTATTTVGIGDGETAEVPDHRTRVAAATALMAEAYGKPAVSIESTGEPAAIIYRTALRIVEAADDPQAGEQ